MHSVSEVVQLYGEAYRKKYRDRMPADQLKAMWCIENCRTGKLGVAIYTCQQCGKAHSIARSCGNRHCPTCQSEKGQQWLEKQLSRLLPCPYFFLCFTVPEPARMIMRSHPKECYNILMEAAAGALRTLAKEPKYIGSSKLSMMAVLHTWGRDLSYNPHVHIVVAAAHSVTMALAGYHRTPITWCQSSLLEGLSSQGARCAERSWTAGQVPPRRVARRVGGSLQGSR